MKFFRHTFRQKSTEIPVLAWYNSSVKVWGQQT
nr:MAG TPA: hypothetical protein [Caudoviricetes sp.]